MKKVRPSIPKAVSEAVLKEYRHRCAMCGRHDPHLHHIDQDPSNNSAGNLLPLCPNCHLQDIHDPTGAPDLEKLKLFRRYKDPLILDPRFHPVFTRARYLHANLGPERNRNFQYFTNELLDFIAEFKMGAFYRKKILNHLNFCYSHYAAKLHEEGQKISKDEVLQRPELKSEAHKFSVECIEPLLVELLRYQEWVPGSFIANPRQA